ncbi:MAG: hypothetical protein PWQ25_2225 [Deferribacteres bacterium]|jgi:hypothetical protein|nr:hypothetical protein [Deferribacteraceae bacterium]MDK2793362.1 hypothetical protein [Deferribacteres bacterium]
MKSKLIILLLIGAISVFGLSGCVAPVVVGAAAGAGATYSLTADSVSDAVDAPKEVIVEKFINIVKKRNGTILFASITEGSVKAEIGNVKLFLNAENVTKGAVKFTIRARKGYNLLPDKETAIEIYTELSQGLK